MRHLLERRTPRCEGFCAFHARDSIWTPAYLPCSADAAPLHPQCNSFGGSASPAQVECSYGASRLIRLAQVGVFAAGKIRTSSKKPYGFGDSDSCYCRPGTAGSRWSWNYRFRADFSFRCYGLLSPACGWSWRDAESRSDRLGSALEVERGGTRVGRRSGVLGCGCRGRRSCPRAGLASAWACGVFAVPVASCGKSGGATVARVAVAPHARSLVCGPPIGTGIPSPGTQGPLAAVPPPCHA